MKPEYDYGEVVRVVRTIRDDGTFPGKQRGDLIVRKGNCGVSAAKSAYLPSLYCATFFAMGSSGTFQGSRASSFSRLSASPICAST